MKTSIKRLLHSAPKQLYRQAVTALLATASLVLLPAACDVKDPIFNTPHPDRGALVLTADWSAREEGAPIPQAYTALLAGQTFALTTAGATGAASATSVILPGLFSPGEATLLAYNQPEGVTIAQGIATIDRAPASPDALPSPDDALQRPDPGLLFSAAATTTIVADDTVHLRLPMRQLFRRVQFALTITGGDPQRITSIEARLEGMAAGVDLATGEVTGEVTGQITGDVTGQPASQPSLQPSSVRLPFVRIANKLTAEILVPGIIPAATQRTVVQLTFSDGKQQTATTDVSQAFANFNDADKLKPLRLSGSLYAPVGSEIEGGSIVNWEDIEGGDVDANLY